MTPRIYTGAEALALAAAAPFGAAPDLAASVAHWHERATAAEEERDRWRDALRGAAAHSLVTLPASPDDAEGLAGNVRDVLDTCVDVAEVETIEADRDAALRHAEELTAALRVARSDLERLRADGRVELRERAERAEEALATERTARARAEAEVDGRGRDLAAVASERDALRACAVSEEPSLAAYAAVEAAGGTILTTTLRVWWHRGPDGELRPMPAVTEAPDAR